MTYVIKCIWDSEAGVWVATSDDVKGLVLESNSYDALIEKVKVAIPELVELNSKTNQIFLSYVSERKDEVFT